MKNQQSEILDYLKAGNKLTVKDALEKLNVYALSQRVGNINKANPGTVKKEMIVTRSGKRIAQYSLA